MKFKTELHDERRPYRQTARAAATEATALRIVEAFRARLERLWFEDIRLEDVAQDAGVTVQTIIRRFGGKEGLLDPTIDAIERDVMSARAGPPGDAAAAVRAVVQDYEADGEVYMRALAQEDRYPAMRRMTDAGRAGHRGWVERVFVSELAGLPPDVARRRLDALVVATDVYVWKLIRRDMGRSVAELQDHMLRLVQAALSISPAPLPQDPAR
jgi:AcrR family transcriptional regulator